MASSLEARRAPISSMLEKYLNTLKNIRKVPHQKSRPMVKNITKRKSFFLSSFFEEFLYESNFAVRRRMVFLIARLITSKIQPPS